MVLGILALAILFGIVLVGIAALVAVFVYYTATHR
jgi:hypothetical protein